MRSKTMFWALALAMATSSAFLPASAAAEFQGFLKINGRQGDSKDDKRKNEIDPTFIFVREPS